MNTHTSLLLCQCYVRRLTLFLGVFIIAHLPIFCFYKTAGLFVKAYKFSKGKKNAGNQEKQRISCVIRDV
ncbi:hypothetical protein [Butyricicoccus pullicaecorum]|uniref:hypothetical protein n=1 Tax=Butyricicoccus pullicaecorum TaxID=501571 RepID=UPI001177E991|nr:hypothetical protein [Butyricicoccus pullicaecorum]